GEKVKALLSMKGDRAGKFIWNTIKPVLLYAAELVGEIADDIVSIDEAMRWGFGWDLGPFELWDEIGLRKSVERMQSEEEEIPLWILKLLGEDRDSFYKKEHGEVLYYDQGTYKEYRKNKRQINLYALKETQNVLKKNTGASLIDLGDGV